MIDDAEKQGLVFDFQKLEGFFGSPIVPTVGSTGAGLEELRRKIYEIGRDPSPQRPVKPEIRPENR